MIPVREIKMTKRTVIVLISFTIFLAGCFGPKGNDTDEKKAAVKTMQEDTMLELCRLHPGAEQEIRDAKGYAVFSNIGFNLLVLSTGSGWGIAHCNADGKETYMKMYSAGLGIGLGVKDFRGIFIFTTEQAFTDFVDNGWQAGGLADAAAKSGEKGGSVEAAFDMGNGINLYQITRNGLAFQATIQGTKFWKDKELN